tara:strand:+ start:309 stop:1430 length:1122 start_codon:yes stop_codon:yes gene_type:complete
MVKDPVLEMVTNAINRPYHDEEYAKKFLLSRFKNIYFPAPTSDIITLDFNWTDGLVSKDRKTISNPLQLAPSINYVYSQRETVSEELTEELTTLTGVWKNTMVGPLYGKPYSKEVPIKYNTIGINYYTFTPDSDFFPKPATDIRDWWKPLYGVYTKLPTRNEKLAVLIATVGKALQSKGLKNIPYYTTAYDYRPSSNSLIQPVNWNPITMKIDYFFASFEWGELLFENPPRLDEKDDTFYEGIVEAQIMAQQKILDWVESNEGQGSDNLFEYFEGNEDDNEYGWIFDPTWKREMGQWLYREWGLQQNWIFNFIDAALGWQFIHLDTWQKDYFTKNREKLEAFRNGPILYFLASLLLPEDDNMEEWIRDHLNDQ